MDEITNNENIASLEDDILKSADALPYWLKYLAAKILSDIRLSDSNIEAAYGYLLEEYGLKEATKKQTITFDVHFSAKEGYYDDLTLYSISNVKGVNALVDNQRIAFHPNLTIIYGENGSGKSGYIRLLKKLFYTKKPETIIGNIYSPNPGDNISAEISFRSEGKDIVRRYPEGSESFSESKQFAVFDTKSVACHLDDKNECIFRPAGLGFFSDLMKAIQMVESMHSQQIETMTTINEYDKWFEGESKVKEFLISLSAETTDEDIQKLSPYSEDDKNNKIEMEVEYNKLITNISNRDKDIKEITKIKGLLDKEIASIQEINRYFSKEALDKIAILIKTCIEKEEVAKTKGVESFNTDKLDGIGSPEWKNFLKAAEEFAHKQKECDCDYPNTQDHCLFCQQPLSGEAQKLIKSYWEFMKSQAEEEANKARQVLNNAITKYQKLDFDLFPNNYSLTEWLKDKYTDWLITVEKRLKDQKCLAETIISDLDNRILSDLKVVLTDVSYGSKILSDINEHVDQITSDDRGKTLQRELKELITYLDHKKKFNEYRQIFIDYIGKLQWLRKAKSVNWRSIKLNITAAEKKLSDNYFSNMYVELFNQECERLDGRFKIKITHSGSSGTSYKAFTLEGNKLTNILSEGEQKVVAIADFLSEMKVSEINRGIIFDDPVNSLDNERKKDIAERLVDESLCKQVVIFTHDLVFVSELLMYCEASNVEFSCHWIENRDGVPGYIFLHNAPCYEKQYRNSNYAQGHYSHANKSDCTPADREYHIKSGFTALRTCYEVLVIYDLFKNVVQRFNERVSIESLKDVIFNQDLVHELLDSFSQCCCYMEGHSHSDKYSYQKPQVKDLRTEIDRYNDIRGKIRKPQKLN